MFCSNCGVKFTIEGKYCYKCGSRQPEVQTAETINVLEIAQEEELGDKEVNEHFVDKFSAQNVGREPTAIERSYTDREKFLSVVGLLSTMATVIVVGIFQSTDKTSQNSSPRDVETSQTSRTPSPISTVSQIKSESEEIVARLEGQGRTFWTECLSRPIIPIPGYLFCFYPTIDDDDICNVSFFDSPFSADKAVREQRIVDLGDVWYGEDPDTGYGLVVSAPSYEDECFVDAMLGLEVEDWWVSNN